MICFPFLHKEKFFLKLCPLSILKERLGESQGSSLFSLKSLLRLLDDRSAEHYISNSKNELMNDPTLIMWCKNMSTNKTLL